MPPWSPRRPTPSTCARPPSRPDSNPYSKRPAELPCHREREVRYRELTLGLELKVWRPGEPDPLAEGLEQLDGYLAGLGLDSGWLVIFDRRPGLPPIAERTSSQEVRSPQGRSIQLVRA